MTASAKQPDSDNAGSAVNLDPLDSRLHAYRKDLADERLQGKVKARHFVGGVKGRIAVPVADLYKQPPRRKMKKTGAETAQHSGRVQDPQADNAPRPLSRSGAETQLLYGAEVEIFSRSRNYAWVQARADSYVGYIRESALVSDDAALLLSKPTHRVAAPRSFVYSEADLRSAPTKTLSMGSIIAIAGEEERRGTRYALLETGEALIAAHLQRLDNFAEDYVAVAESLLHTPYLWGGASAFGIDCSGLVQLSLAMTGRQVLRDSDHQAASIGTVLKNAENLDKLERGDLVFWRGHAAIMCDKKHIIHANGGTMRVSIEPLAQAIERITPQHGRPLVCRRP